MCIHRWLLIQQLICAQCSKKMQSAATAAGWVFCFQVGRGLLTYIYILIYLFPVLFVPIYCCLGALCLIQLDKQPVPNDLHRHICWLLLTRRTSLPLPHHPTTPPPRSSRQTTPIHNVCTHSTHTHTHTHTRTRTQVQVVGQCQWGVAQIIPLNYLWLKAMRCPLLRRWATVASTVAKYGQQLIFEN